MLGYRLLYHKCLKLRAGESVRISFGETILFDKAHIRIDLECEAPRIIIFVLTNGKGAERTLVRYINAEKVRVEFNFAGENEGCEDFSEMYVSVPEDTEFHMGIYLTP